MRRGVAPLPRNSAAKSKDVGVKIVAEATAGRGLFGKGNDIWQRVEKRRTFPLISKKTAWQSRGR